MPSTITGIVTNGVIIPSSPLPEGAHVEIQMKVARPDSGVEGMPRHAAAAAALLAEADYRDDKDLTGFDAFSEEQLDGDESDSL